MSSPPRPTPSAPERDPRVDVSGETELAPEGGSAMAAAMARVDRAEGQAPSVARVTPAPTHTQAMSVEGGPATASAPPPDAPAPDLRPSVLAAAALVGQVIDGRYQLDKVIGEGGMGVVFAGRHKIIGKPIAVKVLRQELARDREIIERFVQEARTASSIGNPHIVDISDFGTLPDGSTYFVMEYLEGENLMDVVDKGRMPLERIYPIALEICEALGAAHDRGIVHRDLKPDNVILVKRSGRDFVKILDFGIAKVTTDSSEKITRAGTVFGTPHYMSPEQAAGRPVDRRADVYALGVMLYEMVAGQLPFDGGEGFMGILTMHMYKAPVPIRAVIGGEGCPPALEAIVQKCLSKRPENRYDTMHALHEDLTRASRGEASQAMHEFLAGGSAASKVPLDYFKQPTPAEPGLPVASVPATRGRSLAPWILLGLVVVGALGVGSWVATRSLRASPTTAEPTIITGAATATAAPSPPPTASVAATAPPGAPVLVRLAVVPRNAAVSVGGKKLDKKEVEVGPGASVEVEVSAPGFEPATVAVDGTSTEKKIELQPKRPGATTVRPPGPPGKGSTGASNLSVRGWE